MVQLKYAAVMAFALSAIAIPKPLPLSPDPAGAKNVGNGAGGQFIGGACLGQADCASACCATLNGAGICSGVGAQFQAGKTGCGFESSGAGSGTAAAAPAASSDVASANTGAAAAIDPNAAGSQNVGKGDGSQFITGQCLSDADCASACCAIDKGTCASPNVSQCGFTG
ncbi:hypothetical protein F5Y15DRAFT_416949 [Xylariaceae sp. FL0016]|nr:hypothetical protein F5Y15DRAFT_416949 [Xylariaceae sp. FL0016]